MLESVSYEHSIRTVAVAGGQEDVFGCHCCVMTRGGLDFTTHIYLCPRACSVMWGQGIPIGWNEHQCCKEFSDHLGSATNEGSGVWYGVPKA